MRNDKFREVRVVSRVTQEDLERKTHISQTRISLIERGLAQPTDDDKVKLARALGTSVKKIFPSKGKQKKPSEGTLLTGATDEKQAARRTDSQGPRGQL